MVEFNFKGRVLPAVHALSIDYRPCVVRIEAADAPSALMEAIVDGGNVTVRIETATFSQDISHQLFGPAWDLVRTLVEAAGFIRGIPYSVVLESVIAPDGTEALLALGDRQLSASQSFTDDDIERVADLSLSDHSLSLAISDLLMSLGKTHYSPIAFGRVADSLARLISPGAPVKVAWQNLRVALNVDEPYLRMLTENAKASRHGDRVPVSGAVTKEMSIRAWTLMDRYLAYRQKGSALSPDEFALLKG